MQISIIIPIYKVEQYIERCIQSVITQIFTDYEVILVDDASPDNALQVAENLLQKSSIEFQAVKHPKNRGLAATRNSGIAVAKGEYIMFMDSDDDLASTQVLQWFYDATQRGDFDLITAKTNEYRAGKINQQQSSFNADLSFQGISIFQNTEIMEAWMNGRIRNEAWNKLLKKQFIKENNLFFITGYQWEDLSWTFDVCSKAKLACVLPQRTYNYYTEENPNAITYQMTFEHIDSSRFHLSRILEKINTDKDLRVALSIESIQRLMMNNIKFILLNKRVINNRQLWVKAYKILGGMYRESFMHENKKKLFFPPQLAYWLACSFLSMRRQRRSIKKDIVKYLFAMNFR